MAKKQKDQENAGGARAEHIGPRMNFAASEAYKMLRTNLMYAMPEDKKCRVMGVTSAERGEGKSTTMLNLAYSMAETGQKVLLVEGDMRLPTLYKSLQVHRAPGLSNLLAGLASVDDVIQPSGMAQNMFVITSGTIPPNPVELLGAPRMEQELENIRQFFDVILFDLPPINIVADGLALSSLLDGMVVVVRREYSERRQVAEVVRRLQFLNVKILGFVMTNGSENGGYKRYSRRNYYKKYGSEYKNGYGYESSKPDGNSKNTADGSRVK